MNVEPFLVNTTNFLIENIHQSRSKNNVLLIFLCFDLLLHICSHRRTSCKNVMTTTLRLASTSCVSKHHYRSSTYPNGSANTIHRTKMIAATLAVAMCRAALPRNATRMHPAVGVASIPKPPRSVRWVRSDRIVAHCCWAHRRTVITVKQGSHDGQHRIWTRVRHRRRRRREAHSRAAATIPASCQAHRSAINRRTVHAAHSDNRIWDGAAKRNYRNREHHTNGKCLFCFFFAICRNHTTAIET